MVEVLKSLEEITTGYSVFEPDQVLTHSQLNRLCSYLDDQDRLTRVSLIGVGIACGLRPSIVDERVRVTKGVGVTTDGDLLRLGGDELYAGFRPYDEAAPRYAPFFPDGVAGTRVRLWELTRKQDEPGARPLARFKADAEASLQDMVVVLLMESYVHDPDLCSGTDCDNLGQDAIHTPRLLLVEASTARRLRETLETLDSAARRLPHVVAARPVISRATTTPETLVAAYRQACQTTLAALRPALEQLYPTCRELLRDVFPSDPGPAWSKALAGIASRFAHVPRGIQYYYDFLRDLVETYDEFLALLIGDTTLCAPDLLAFPKHLLLGRLAPQANASDDRTGFYPSPALRVAGGRGHARFLARKLEALILGFEVPPGPLQVRVTPSRFTESRLEDRAIPYYYQNVAESWSYSLHRRGWDTHNYSYHAAADAPGGAAKPLEADIARFPFFRVEGQLGANVKDALAAVSNEVKTRNLPLDVRAVMLDRDRSRLPIKPPIRFTDLHRLHHVLRQDIASQLDDVTKFSTVFKDKVGSAVDIDTGAQQAAFKTKAEDDDAILKDKAALAKGTLTKAYTEYRKDASWKNSLRDTLQAAGTFKVDLAAVARTEFATPFDKLITSPHVHWLDWLDDIIRRRDEKEEERQLFGAFFDEHPGLEHQAGALRGGTLVLAYDAQGTVVADFALPYRAAEPAEADAEEPALPPPVVKPPFIVDRGITILPSRNRLLDDFKKQLEPEWKGVVDLQKKYFDTFKDSITLIGSAYSGLPKPGGGKLKDPDLDERLKDTLTKAERVDFIRDEILKAADDDTRKAALEASLGTAEAELAKSVASTTRYVVTSATPVAAGSEGLAVMTAVSGAVTKISSASALKEAAADLKAAKKEADTKNRGAVGLIDSILKTRGLG